MKRHAIKGFHHGVLGLPENPTLWPGFSVKTPRASPQVFWLQKPVRPGWVFSQAQNHMIKTYSNDAVRTIILQTKQNKARQNHSYSASYQWIWCPNHYVNYREQLTLHCSHINPLPAKFFSGSKNIHLHFMSLLHIDMTQVVGILPQVRQWLTYSTKSISWELMSWRRKEPGHQQPW